MVYQFCHSVSNRPIVEVPLATYATNYVNIYLSSNKVYETIYFYYHTFICWSCAVAFLEERLAVSIITNVIPRN